MKKALYKLIGIFLCVSLLVVYHDYKLGRSETIIRSRYNLFQKYLAGNAERELRNMIAPANRRQSRNSDLGRLASYIVPLESENLVVVQGDRAWVYPRAEKTVLPSFIFGLLENWLVPGGNGIELIESDGEWYFTGTFHIN